METAWRLVKPEYADDAFSGAGARLHGGRWNSRGHSMVYTASNAALATLELCVGIRRPYRLREYTMISCHFPEALVEEIDVETLPENWTASPAPPDLAARGTAWLLSGSSAILKVPSAVVPIEFNYLLNPEHPDFRSIDIGQPRPFRLDFRLLT